MFGAILGDIIGSPYEFDRGDKTKNFSLFSPRSRFTDDTVMTLAVAEAFLNAPADASDEEMKALLVKHIRRLGRTYPRAGYGSRFSVWLQVKNPIPYNSFGNGAAMRVSSAAWLFDDLDAVLRAARLSAEVTHNHPEGIKGAQATAAAIFLARIGSSKAEIKAYIEETFGYDLSRTCDEIRPGYRHVESCQESVPEAITAFLEGTSFEDVIRTAISLGGDTDTLAAIAGSIAEGFYGVSGAMRSACLCRLPEELQEILLRFDEVLSRRGLQKRESAMLHDAIHFATDMHSHQLRKGTSLPYILHPLETMTVLRAMHADPNLLMAGVLHDTIEDTEAAYIDLLFRFGRDVADLVNAHTEDKSLPWQVRKQHTIDTIAAGDRRLRMLILADKVSNLRSIAADLRRPDNNVWSRFKKPKEDQRWYYCSSLEAVRDLEGDPDIGPVCREMAELCREVFGAD